MHIAQGHGLEGIDGRRGTRRDVASSYPAGRVEGSRGLLPEDDGQAAGGPSRFDDRVGHAVAGVEAANQSGATAQADRDADVPWPVAAHRRRAFVLVTACLLMAAFVAFIVSRRGPVGIENHGRSPVSSPDGRKQTQPEKLTTQVSPVQEQRMIFDGKSGHGWMLCNRAPLPRQNIQPDGLNPHQSGSYLVVYDQKLGDFVLDFDYKLTKGCNSGVFLRVSDLNNPVQTGIEVALDDARRGDDRDSGAFQGLAPPTVYAQKPAGHWNHMTITAQGPLMTVTLNETQVSSINLDSVDASGQAARRVRSSI